jgi:cytidine deaminase
MSLVQIKTNDDIFFDVHVEIAKMSATLKAELEGTIQSVQQGSLSSAKIILLRHLGHDEMFRRC